MVDGQVTEAALEETVGLEKEVKELSETAGIDPDLVDLGLPKEYEIRIMAHQRLTAAREAVVLKRLAAANKAVNEKRYEELRREFIAKANMVALIDRYHPEAKREAQELADEALAKENQQRTL